MPTSTHPQDYVTAINTLPEEDDPACFGLPANINRSAQRNGGAKVSCFAGGGGTSYDGEI
jgi:hypothetical protein